MKKKSYIVRWAVAGQPERANVTIMAVSDHTAKKQADATGKELGVHHMPRTIYESGRCVDERSWLTPTNR
jgi:hypothetical protein